MQTLDEKFIGLDTYGVPVSVNYRGDDTYKTRFGALLSLISYFLLISFAIRKGIDLLDKSSPSISITNEVIDYANDDTQYNLLDQSASIIIETNYEMSRDDGSEYFVPHVFNETFGRIVAF